MKVAEFLAIIFEDKYLVSINKIIKTKLFSLVVRMTYIIKLNFKNIKVVDCGFIQNK